MKRLFTLFVFLGGLFICNAQVNNISQAQSLYIYNFSRLIQWPSGSQTGEFVIGVIGKDELYNNLISYVANKKVGTQSIAIRKFDTPESVTRCHILFVGNKKLAEFNNVLDRLRGANSLIITEKKGMIKSGSAIDFFFDEDKLKFVINTVNAEKYNLTVSKSLQDMAYEN